MDDETEPRAYHVGVGCKDCATHPRSRRRRRRGRGVGDLSSLVVDPYAAVNIDADTDGRVEVREHDPSSSSVIDRLSTATNEEGLFAAIHTTTSSSTSPACFSDIAVLWLPRVAVRSRAARHEANHPNVAPKWGPSAPLRHRIAARLKDHRAGRQSHRYAPALPPTWTSPSNESRVRTPHRCTAADVRRNEVERAGAPPEGDAHQPGQSSPTSKLLRVPLGRTVQVLQSRLLEFEDEMDAGTDPPRLAVDNHRTEPP